MEVMFVMILTKEKKLILLMFSFILISSCETLNEIAGLNKVEIDDSLYAGTPDLILPPDFDKDPISSVTTKKNINQQIPQPNYPQMSPYQSVSPRVTNFFFS
jgi:hypothetical protein